MGLNLKEFLPCEKSGPWAAFRWLFCLPSTFVKENTLTVTEHIYDWKLLWKYKWKSKVKIISLYFIIFTWGAM